MKLVVTLSGHSNRFIKAGYKEKAFIEIFGKTIIENLVSMFSPPIEQEEIIFIARNDSNLSKKILPKLFQNSKHIFINPNKDGPVVSILSANLKNFIGKEEEVIVSYCDFYFPLDIDRVLDYFRSYNADAGVLTHNGFHPHRIYNSSFAYIKQNKSDIIEIKEKGHFTDTPMNEPASSGVYYFKKFHQMDQYFKEYVKHGERVNNEFYVTLPFNFMIRDGMKVMSYETSRYICLGTPKDLELLESWKTIIKHLPKSNEDEILSTYKYWKSMQIMGEINNG